MDPTFALSALSTMKGFQTTPQDDFMQSQTSSLMMAMVIMVMMMQMVDDMLED